MHTPDETVPLISILMGVRYQRDDLSLLKRAICSIRGQTYSNWEFLICERDSFQVAQAYLKQIAKEDSRIRLIDSQGTAGLSGQLNRCLKVAKGEWIARMDDDDFSHSDRLAVQMEYLRKNPQVAFVGCNVALCQDGEDAGMWSFPENPKERDFYMTQPYIHPTLLFRREALERVRGYCEEKRCVLCEDYDLLLRLYVKGFLGANLQQVLFTYTLPTTAKGQRKMIHRWNEAVTRWQRFRELGVLPGALPWVVKPLVVGLLPEKLLKRVKEKRVEA